MPTILIVDDNEENRDSLSRRLQRHGYSTLIAIDGETGMAMAASEKPDLILMDLNMPNMDGWETTRQIKAIETLRDTPIVALTAYALTGDRERAIEAGCVDYHAKPIEFAKLIEQIEALMHFQGGMVEAANGGR